MSGSEQLTFNVAMSGADEVGSGLDSLDGKLKNLSSEAETASGSGGIGGLGSAADKANTPVGSLGTSAGNLSTKVGALSTAMSATAGGVLDLTSSYEGLEKGQTGVETATKRVETATTAHEKAIDALNKIIKDGTATQADYAKALDKISTAEKTVGDDQQRIRDDLTKINTLWREGKGNTIEYSDAVHKLGDDQGKLATDTGKLHDAQKAYTDLVQKHVDTTNPKYIEALQRVQTTGEQVTIAQEKLKESTASLNTEWEKFALSIGQTALGAVGAVSAAISTFGKNSGTAKTALGELEQGSTSMGGSLKALGVIGLATGIAMAVVGTNAFGSRDALNAFGKTLGDQVPLLQPVLTGIKMLGQDLGLTGNDAKATSADMKTSMANAAASVKGFTDSAHATLTMWASDTKKIQDDVKNKDWKAFNADVLKLFTDTFDAIKKGLQALATWLGPAFNASLKVIVDGFHSAAQIIVGSATALGQQILQAIEGGLGKIASWFKSNVIDPITAGWKSFVGVLTQLLQPAIDGIKTAWTTLTTALKTTYTDLKTGWTTFTTGLKTAWDTATSGIKTAWDTIVTGLKTTYTDLKTAWTTFTTALKTAWDTATGGIKSAWDTIASGLKTSYTDLKSAWTTFTTGLKTDWDTVTTGVKTTWNTIVTALKATYTDLKTAWDTFTTDVSTTWKTVTSGIKTAWDTVSSGLKTGFTDLKTAWGTFTDSVKTTWTTATQGIQTAWTTTKTALTTGFTAVQSAWSTIMTTMKSAWDTFVQDVQTAIRTIQTAIQTVMNAITAAQQAASRIGGAVQGGATGVVQGFGQAAQNFLQGFGVQPLTNAHATINPSAIIVNTPGGLTTAATLSNQPIVVNLNVSGRRLAQVMAPFNSGTSAFS